MTASPQPEKWTPIAKIAVAIHLTLTAALLIWLTATVAAWRADDKYPALLSAVCAVAVAIFSGRALFRMWRYRGRVRAAVTAGRLLWGRLQQLSPDAVYENRESRTRYIRTTQNTPIGQLDELIASDLDHDYAAEAEADRTGRGISTARSYEINSAHMVVMSVVRAYRVNRDNYTSWDADQPLRRRVWNWMRAMRGERRAARLGQLVVREDEIRELIKDLDGTEEFGRG